MPNRNKLTHFYCHEKTRGNKQYTKIQINAHLAELQKKNYVRPGQPDRVSSLDHSPLRAFVCLNGWARALCAPVRSRPSPGNQFMPRYDGRHSGWHFASVLTSKVITMKYKYFNGYVYMGLLVYNYYKKGGSGRKGSRGYSRPPESAPVNGYFGSAFKGRIRAPISWRCLTWNYALTINIFCLQG